MAYRSRVVFSERSRPEIFCWVNLCRSITRLGVSLHCSPT